MLRTVGHGTLTADAFAALVQGAGVGAVVDVRRSPGSRRHPHFSRAAMQRWLPEAGIGYRWEERLGGRRRQRPDSVNVGLRDAGFRAYADHMAERAFWDALDGVLRDARQRPTAVMCAESVWWRCHRRLIADAVVLVRGDEVGHLLHDGSLSPHAVTDAARRVGDRIHYDRLTQSRLSDGGG